MIGDQWPLSENEESRGSKGPRLSYCEGSTESFLDSLRRQGFGGQSGEGGFPNRSFNPTRPAPPVSTHPSS